MQSGSDAGHSAQRGFQSQDPVDAGGKEWWMLYQKEDRLRGDVITDFGFGGDVIWRMVTSCSLAPVKD